MEFDSSWLTVRRLRAHGLMLAACLWLVYAVDLSSSGLRDFNGLIKGTDFLHFYTLGILASHKQGALLYDMPAQSALMQQIVRGPATVYVPLYGPQVSLLFSPFALLPYGLSLAAWLLLNATIYSLCVYAVWKCCPSLQRHGWTVLILALAFPGFFNLIAWGQTSELALACFTLAFLALRSGRLFLAGLAIGCLIFKPQLGLAAAVVFILRGEAKLLLGAGISGLTQLAVGWGYYGTQVMRNYWQAWSRLGEVLPLLEPRPYQMHSLRAFWGLLLPWPGVAFGLYMASAVVALVLVHKLWTTTLPLGLRYSGLLLATVLVSPHLTVYDLVILAPTFLLLSDWIVETQVLWSSAIPDLLYACYPLFLLGPAASLTHLQLSVVAMMALLWLSNAATLNTP